MNEYTITYSAAEILDIVVKNIQTIFYCIMLCYFSGGKAGVFILKYYLYHHFSYFYFISECHNYTFNFLVIASTGSIFWILWFSVHYTAAAVRRQIFGVNALRGKRQQLASPNLQDIFIGG